MAEIITDGSQKELKKHGSDEFPLLVSYEKLSGYKSGSFLWHWHPEIEITLVLDGQILYKVNQCTYHMKAGDILLGNANVLHAGFMEDMKDGWNCFLLYKESTERSILFLLTNWFCCNKIITKCGCVPSGLLLSGDNKQLRGKQIGDDHDR